MTDEVDSLKYDFDLLDRFQSFSAEIVRLALLMPMLLASLATWVGKGAGPESYAKLFGRHSGLLALAAVALFIAIAAGLAHRYYAIDFLATYIQRLRSTDTARSNALTAQVAWRLGLCAPLLAAGAIALAIGSGAGLLLAYRIAIGA